MVAGQAPVTLELRNTPGKNTNKPKVVHTHITADAIDASTGNMEKLATVCQVHTGAYVSLLTSHYSGLEKPPIPLATQEKRLPRIYYT